MGHPVFTIRPPITRSATEDEIIAAKAAMSLNDMYFASVILADTEYMVSPVKYIVGSSFVPTTRFAISRKVIECVFSACYWTMYKCETLEHGYASNL